jgi:hypothetical protein
MALDLFRSRSVEPVVETKPTPTAAFAIRGPLRTLCEDLVLAGRFRDACRKVEARRGLPPLFFFDRTRQAELVTARGPAPAFPEPFASEAARRFPREAKAWQDVTEQWARLRPWLFGDVHLRQTARAIHGLISAARAVSVEHPVAREITDLLATLDEETLLVLDPAARVGHRVEVQGVADINQLQALLADVLPGLRLQFARLFTFAGLRSDATLPQRWNGTEHWLWGQMPASVIPFHEGQRVVLVGEASVPVVLSEERRFPDLPAEGRIVHTMTRSEVHDCLTRWTGRPVAEAETPVGEFTRAA